MNGSTEMSLRERGQPRSPSREGTSLYLRVCGVEQLSLPQIVRSGAKWNGARSAAQSRRGYLLGIRADSPGATRHLLCREHLVRTVPRRTGCDRCPMGRQRPERRYRERHGSRSRLGNEG